MRKQSRPGVRNFTARAAGIPERTSSSTPTNATPTLLADKPAAAVGRGEALPCGDGGLKAAGQLVAAVERKALADPTARNGNLYTTDRTGRAATGRRGGRGPPLGDSHPRPPERSPMAGRIADRLLPTPIVFCQTQARPGIHLPLSSRRPHPSTMPTPPRPEPAAAGPSPQRRAAARGRKAMPAGVRDSSTCVCRFCRSGVCRPLVTTTLTRPRGCRIGRGIECDQPAL